MLRIRRRTAVAGAAVGILIATVGAGKAATGTLSYRACFAHADTWGCVVPAQPSLEGATDVAVSPDGKSVYVTAATGYSLTVFSRATNGALTYRGCFANGGAHGCVAPLHDSLGYAEGVAVTRDGRSVYVVSGHGHGITSFARASNGVLTYQGCIANGGANGCTAPPYDSLSWAEGVAVSPDGKSVYVAARDSNALTRFARAADGSLTWMGCWQNAAVMGCAAPAHNSLTGTMTVAVSPDGKSVYTAAPFASSISRFNRAADGSLTYVGCIANGGYAGCTPPAHDSLGYAFDVTVSGDGRSVYVASGLSHSVTSFVRGSGGGLTYQGCIANEGNNGCFSAAKASLLFPTAVEVSPDGASVYVTARDGESISTFDRASDGSLAFGDCIANGGVAGCAAPAHDSLGGAYGVAVSPDGTSVYTAAWYHGVTVFSRELPSPNTRLGSTRVHHAQRTVTFRFSSTQKPATFSCRLDGKPWRHCDGPKTYRDLHPGRHTFAVKARNSQRKWDPSPARKQFRI